MIVEQIRYFVGAADHEAALQARRRLSELRQRFSLPVGRILVADPLPDEGPSMLWQCAYGDESEMAGESVLLDHEEYEQARATLAALCSHVEIEIYLDDTMNDMTSPVED